MEGDDHDVDDDCGSGRRENKSVGKPLDGQRDSTGTHRRGRGKRVRRPFLFVQARLERKLSGIGPGVAERGRGQGRGAQVGWDVLQRSRVAPATGFWWKKSGTEARGD